MITSITEAAFLALMAVGQSAGFSTFDLSAYNTDTPAAVSDGNSDQPAPTDSGSDQAAVAESTFSSFVPETGSTAIPAAAASKFKFSGRAVLDARLYLNQDLKDFKNTYALLPYGDVTINYQAPSSEIILTGRLSKEAVTDYPEDLLHEMILRAFWKSFVFEAGKEIIVWGKGDKLHILDNFNANDYTNFIVPDYLDRRLAEPLLRAIWNGPSGLRLEIVYAPLMTADRLATSGPWTPQQYTDIANKVTGVEGAIVSKTMAEFSGTTAEIAGRKLLGSLTEEEATIAMIESSSTLAKSLVDILDFKAENIYPDTRKAKYGQAGIRLTGTAGAFDWGVSYYYGHNKQPSINYEKYLTSLKENSGKYSLELPELDYDRQHVFGFEGAFAAGVFNFRFEAGYFLTEDIAGDNPWIHNNSVQWLAGFDVDLPLHNLYLNVQTTGKVVLFQDGIKNGTYKEYDVDYDLSGKFTNNKLVVNLSDTFFNEKLKAEIYFVWGIERQDIFLMPKLTWTMKDSFELNLTGLYMYSPAKGEFSAFNNNDFIQIGVKYIF